VFWGCSMDEMGRSRMVLPHVLPGVGSPKKYNKVDPSYILGRSPYFVALLIYSCLQLFQDATTK